MAQLPRFVHDGPVDRVGVLLRVGGLAVHQRALRGTELLPPAVLVGVGRHRRRVETLRPQLRGELPGLDHAHAHIHLARWATVALVAPLSANTLAKVANVS